MGGKKSVREGNKKRYLVRCHLNLSFECVRMTLTNAYGNLNDESPYPNKKIQMSSFINFSKLNDDSNYIV